MLTVVFQAITWGLLAIFVGFLVYGAGIVLYTLVNFYRGELAKLNANRERELTLTE